MDLLSHSDQGGMCESGLLPHEEVRKRVVRWCVLEVGRKSSATMDNPGICVNLQVHICQHNPRSSQYRRVCGGRCLLTWFVSMWRPFTSYKVAVVAKHQYVFMVRVCRSLNSPGIGFTHKLHIIYLINDVLHHW